MKIENIDEAIRRRERGYIWLERELKMNLVMSTAIIAVFFVFMFFINPSKPYQAIFFAAAVLVNGIWQFCMYRREYGNYMSIVCYLEEFEAGNYEYRMENDYMKTGIHSQITEQLERMGSAFHTLKDRIVEEKENTKRFVTDISHQLKTPVAALKISYELLRDTETIEAEKQEFFMRSERDLEKLNQLLGTFTDLSRLEADMIQLCPGEQSLKETLLRAVNGVYLKAEKKDIKIELDDFTDIKLVHDIKWTAEAISNILDNAVKYSPSGTEIKIRVHPLVSSVLIEVEDEGIGIPKAEYSDIFKRFYRGKRPEVEKAEGAGVGLYLARYILEEQGGSIRVRSLHQKGTVMQIMLPKDYM